MRNSSALSEARENPRSLKFPYDVFAYTLFAIIVTILDHALTSDVKEHIIPFTGWTASVPYSVTIFFGVWFCITRNPKALYGVACPLILQMCFGFAGYLTPEREDFGNPYLTVSLWRPVWTLAIPLLWLIVIFYSRLWRYFGPHTTSPIDAAVKEDE